MKSTHPIAYRYEVEGHEVVIERIHVGTAYARNGNVGNPTEYFKWNYSVDGEVISWAYQRALAYEEARASILGIPYYWNPAVPNRSKNVRPYTLVQDEMQANYRGRVKS